MNTSREWHHKKTIVYAALQRQNNAIIIYILLLLRATYACRATQNATSMEIYPIENASKLVLALQFVPKLCQNTSRSMQHSCPTTSHLALSGTIWGCPEAVRHCREPSGMVAPAGLVWHCPESCIWQLSGQCIFSSFSSVNLFYQPNCHSSFTLCVNLSPLHQGIAVS